LLFALDVLGEFGPHPIWKGRTDCCRPVPKAWVVGYSAWQPGGVDRYGQI